MAAIIDTDVSINAGGDIRWTGAATTNTHTVLEFIQFLMDKQDDEQAAGNDLLDITVDTPFDRSTDQIMSLNFPFNIDDTFATHLYDGSVSQTDLAAQPDNTLYSGIAIIGPVESGTEYMILQDGKILPAFWGTGINPEAAPSLVFSRHLVKTRSRGADIDSKKVLVLARRLGDQYRRFPATLGTGNSVAAIGNGADIFNAQDDPTIAGFTEITNTEGFQELDIDLSGPGGQEYYSQWDRDVRSVNDTYERTKWISQNAGIQDFTATAPTSADFTIDNGTIFGQGQHFAVTADAEYLTEFRFQIQIGTGAPTGDLHAELYLSDDAGSQLDEPTGAALARSEPVLGTSIQPAASGYQEVIFRFNRFDPVDGSDQTAGLLLTDDTAGYFAVLRHPNGGAGDFFEAGGASTDVDSSMNQAVDTGTWAASATADLNVIVRTSSAIHGMPGEQMQGINIEVVYTGESGAGVPEDDMAYWGTRITYDGLTGSFIDGEYVTFVRASVLVSGGRVLFDDGTDMVVALENPIAGAVADDDVIFGLVSGAIADATATIADEDLSGGIGVVLAKDDNGAGGEVYLQVIMGANPVATNVIRNHGSGTGLADFLDVSTFTTRTVSPEYLGTSTGSNIIGAYGIGFNPDDVGASDLFTSLDNAPRTPPNNVTFTVAGLAAGEDRVLVGPRAIAVSFIGNGTTDLDFSGSTITRNAGSFITDEFLIGQTLDITGSLLGNDGTVNVTIVTALVITVAESFTAETNVAATITQTAGLNRRMWLVNTLLNGVAETALVVKTGTDTVPFPTSPTEINWESSGIGTADEARLRIERDNGIYERIPYDSHDGIDTFTLGTPLTGTVNMEVSQVGGTGGQFDFISGGSTDFLADGFETGCTFSTLLFTDGGNNSQFTAASVTATTIVVTDDTAMANESAGGGNETMTSDGWNFLSGEQGEAAVNNDVFLAFIDVLASATTEAFTGVHETNGDRNLFVRVRDGGATPIKTFESLSATFTATSSTIAAVRTNDF